MELSASAISWKVLLASRNGSTSGWIFSANELAADTFASFAFLMLRDPVVPSRTPLVVGVIDLKQGTRVHALWTFQGMISSQTVLTTTPQKQDQIAQ